MHMRSITESDMAVSSGDYCVAVPPLSSGDRAARAHFMEAFREKSRRRALYSIQKGLYWSGLAAMYTTAMGIRGATLHMYHSVPGPGVAAWIDPRYCILPGQFDAQMRFLRRRRNVISYSKLIETLEREEDLAAGTVVITFDDGYLDTLRVAAPILARYGLPAIVFVSTAYTERGEPQWGDQLFSLFVNHTRHVLEVSSLGIHAELQHPAVKAAAYDALSLWFIRATADERHEMLADLEKQLRPAFKPPRLTMTWAEVRELVERFPNIKLGLHGAEHLDMSAHDPVVLQCELDRCIEDFQREVGWRAEHFAYPYNRVTAKSREMVRQCGFRSAVACGPRVLISCASDRFALPRIEACRSMSLVRFRTSGAYPGLSMLLTRRA